MVIDMRIPQKFPHGRGLAPFPRFLLAIAATLALGACDSLLEVEDPDVATPASLEGAEGVPTLVNGAILDFASAYNGPFNMSLVPLQGLFTDEYFHAGTFTDRDEVSRRRIDRTDNQAVRQLFEALHAARASASRAGDQIVEFEPTNPNLAQMRSYAGFAEVFLAESFCSGVPESTLEGGAIVFGEPRTTAQVLESAVGRFDLALAADPGADLARVGKGRALLNLGRFADAAAAVAAVPTDFEEPARYSSTQPSQNNGLWGFNTNGRISVWDLEGGNGLPFRSADDPRVPWVDSGDLGFDENTQLFLTLLAPDIDSDMVLASGIEARLIEAEATLQAGGSALPTLNALRATVGLPPLADPGTPAGRVDQLFRERAFWFYSSAHRLGDMRRLIRQYGRDAETVFPTGPYPKGDRYGTDVNFPIPIEEDNNPNTSALQTGCLNRDA
jgi:hypothetical protein